MKTKLLKTFGICLTLGTLSAIPVKAAFIDVNFSTTGVGQFVLAPSTDELRVDAQGSTAIHITDSAPIIATINNLFFYVGDSGQLTGNFGYSLNRTMTISSDTQSLAQNGTLSVTLAADQFLVLSGSSPMVFHLAEGDITVTPLTLTTAAYGVGGSGNYDLQAEFSFAPVPEPTTVVAGALLLLPFGASTIRILRRNRV